jgi:hypothetical protein
LLSTLVVASIFPVSRCLKLRTRCLIVLRRGLHGRVRVTNNDRWFFIQLYRWSLSILNIQSETLVRWHRAGVRCYWRWNSRPAGGRSQIETEARSDPADERRKSAWGTTHPRGTEVSAVEPDDDEGIEQVGTDSWNNEQVHGGNVRRVTQEGSPSLAGRSASFDHVRGDADCATSTPSVSATICAVIGYFLREGPE